MREGQRKNDARRRILVVEDHADLRESFALLLQSQGHEVHTAADGPSALLVVPKLRPEVVLLDLGLPGMDGFTVARRLREAIREPMMLIAVSGYGEESDRRRAAEAGFDHHLLKPVDFDRLEALLADSV